MDYQGLIINQGIWCYKCRIYSECSPKAKALQGTKQAHAGALGLEMLPMTSYFVHLLSSQPSTVSWVGASILQRECCGHEHFTPSSSEEAGVAGPLYISWSSGPHNKLGDLVLQLNPNVAQAARPLETTDSSSTVTVTADLMGGKEVCPKIRVEELDSSLALG
ncbi:hypothetical protein HAX54_028911 [Datura stramonium]|uniref:Uncharacterized protein n=1 Tax=Datura stramonium TaxID=4076 RepID=A0ABS8V7Q1_DATST|nr:hypothetical protein [Datura stramonium]